MSSSVAHWAVGIDVAIKSAHKVSILDRRTGQPIRRTLSVARTFEGVHRLKEILSEADRVEVAIEPAGNAWRPLAGALMAYGFDVYLVDPKKSSRLRKALSDHVKSDRVDAEAFYERECQGRAPPRLDAKPGWAWHSAPAWLE